MGNNVNEAIQKCNEATRSVGRPGGRSAADGRASHTLTPRNGSSVEKEAAEEEEEEEEEQVNVMKAALSLPETRERNERGRGRDRHRVGHSS